MFKFKNKTTGEVITTPYLAEAEEYRLNDNYIEVNMSKPIYTKEMHERGELPPVGSEVYWSGKVCIVLINEADTDNCIVIVCNGEYVNPKVDCIKPIPTIEDELFDITTRFIGAEMTQADLVYELLDKFNITPNDS